jgi:phosphate transport system permease protein
VPLGVVTAVWVVEYGRPRWLGRIVESSVEMIAGTPDIVIAIFGLALFQLGFFSRRSRSARRAAALRPLVPDRRRDDVVPRDPADLHRDAQRAALATPRQMREASYALGKTRIATIRRVVLPAVRRDIATGSTLGLARIIGDTAIVILLLGATLQNSLQSEGRFGFSAAPARP